jgi:hypothetical protein
MEAMIFITPDVSRLRLGFKTDLHAGRQGSLAMTAADEVLPVSSKRVGDEDKVDRTDKIDNRRWGTR